MNEKNRVAGIILQQLGGRRFESMTGARRFDVLDRGLEIRFPNRAPAPNVCKIVLTDEDLYDLTFYRVQGANVAVTAEKEGYYADQLQAAFTDATGLDTHL